MNVPVNCDELIQLIPAYSIGATDAEETRLVETSLRECPEALQALRYYQTAQTQLAVAVPQVQPPAELLGDLLLQAGQSRPRRLGWYAAVACLALLLLGSNVFWALRTEALHAAAVDQVEVLVLPAAANGSSSASAQVVWMPATRGAIFATNFPVQAQDRVYQAWVTRGTEISSLGTFQVDEQGAGALLFAAHELAGGFDAVGITLEPGEGSPQPTSRPVVRWQQPS